MFSPMGLILGIPDFRASTSLLEQPDHGCCRSAPGGVEPRHGPEARALHSLLTCRCQTPTNIRGTFLPATGSPRPSGKESGTVSGSTYVPNMRSQRLKVVPRFLPR